MAAVTMEELLQQCMVLKLCADGTVLFQEKPVALDALAGTLRRAIRARSDAELILDVEDEVLHDMVVQVLDAAGAAEIEKVLFVSRPRAATGRVARPGSVRPTAAYKPRRVPPSGKAEQRIHPVNG
jgi:biopolymer transport protein ExbD